MPSYSGLWDGEHGQSYAAMPKQDAAPPFQRGIVRVLMQGRGMHGHVSALGRNSPASIAQVDAAVGDQSLKGTFDYAGWKADPTGDNTARDVTVTHLGSVEPVTGEVIARVPDATEVDMLNTYDTTLNNNYPGDAAGSGVTGPALAGEVSDGT